MARVAKEVIEIMSFLTEQEQKLIMAHGKAKFADGDPQRVAELAGMLSAVRTTRGWIGKMYVG